MIFAPFIDFIIPFILIATGTLQTVYYFLVKRSIENWPTIGAQVVYSHLFNAPNQYTGREYEAVIHVKYSFRGKEYVSEETFLKGLMFPSRSEAEEEKVARYPVGEHVNVKVNPRYPEIAYIGVEKIHWLPTILIPTGIILYIMFTVNLFGDLFDMFSNG